MAQPSKASLHIRPKLPLPLATQGYMEREVGKNRPLKSAQETKEGERDTDWGSNIVFASCCHWQADWELICTHYLGMSRAGG